MERGIDMKKKLGALLLACLMMFTVAAVPASAAATSPIVQVTAGNAQAPFDAVIYRPYTEIKGGFVFYPGAMVDYRDYGPLLTAIARQGYLIISVEFPLDFACANPAACYPYMAKYPEIKHWFIGGHSLGGSICGVTASLDFKRFDGIVLFASFLMDPAAFKDIPVLSIYGSNDGVLVKPMYELFKFNASGEVTGKQLTPKNQFTEVVIEGGNHAQFGDYGKQMGDNDATISAEEQVSIASEAVGNFFRTYGK